MSLLSSKLRGAIITSLAASNKQDNNTIKQGKWQGFGWAAGTKWLSGKMASSSSVKAFSCQCCLDLQISKQAHLIWRRALLC